MKELVALSTYVFEVLKFFVISYYIIGLRPSEKKIRFLLIPILITLGVGVYYQEHFSLSSNMILIISIIFLWFHEEIRLSVLSIIIEWATVSFIDLMMWLICVTLTPLGNMYQNNLRVIEIISNFLGVLPILLMSYIMKSKKYVFRDKLKDIHLIKYTLIILIIVAMCLVSACMQGVVLGEMTGGTRRLVILATIVLSFFVVALCILYINVADSRKQLAEINALNEKCIEYQKDYYTSVMKKDEELRAFKHDVNKHMQALKVLSQEKRYDEIDEYLEAFGDYAKTDYIYKTGNLIADYIINAKIQEISEHGPLSVQIIGKFPRNIKLGNTEMCIILANILDNAKEAILESRGDKKLELEIRNYRDRLFVTVKNSSPKRKFEYGESTKKDKENHGYGMQNVRRIIEKYDGNIEMKWDNYMFITEIEL